MHKHKFVRGMSLLAGVGLLLTVAAGVNALNPTGNGRIIYWGYNNDTDQFGITSMAPDGSDKQSIINSTDGQYTQSSKVSPDGTKIAYNLYDNDSDPFKMALAIADFSGLNKTIILQLPNDYIGDVTWSPDNTKLMYIKNDGTTFEPSVWTINADGTNNQAVNITGLGEESILRSIAWSSNNKLAYTLDGHLYSSNVDGSDPVDLTSEAGWTDATITSASWSTDGDKLVFSAFDCPDGGGCIATSNADGSNKQVVTSNPSLTGSCGEELYNDASFSPDGTKIVYSNTATCG